MPLMRKAKRVMKSSAMKKNSETMNLSSVTKKRMNSETRKTLMTMNLTLMTTMSSATRKRMNSVTRKASTMMRKTSTRRVTNSARKRMNLTKTLRLNLTRML